MPFYARTSRDRVIIHVFDRAREEETVSPINTEGVVGVLAWNVCEHGFEQSRRIIKSSMRASKTGTRGKGSFWP